ncbi:DUF6477 family protein [Prosthecodimorpha staleyi]|uniref:DUF6477 family protein n=1 Tax=Prosthecodimorpha staleyi TaxID=2840188 RepID=UPI0021C2EFA7|nr:DUF6477 family protein [Prosthecodimorpha staleyi]
MATGLDARLRGSVGAALAKVVAIEASRYKREHALPRLLPIGPDLLADQGRAARLHVLKLLARALRGERSRGRAGHWTYSLDRHLALITAYRAEKAALSATMTTATDTPKAAPDGPGGIGPRSPASGPTPR